MKTERYFWVYLLECENGTYYTGYAKNLATRYYKHKHGIQGAKFTRSFKPIRIAQCWRLFDSVGTALKVERFIKNQKRKTKERWVLNPEELKSVIADKMNLDLRISPFNSSRVEEESGKLDIKQVNSGFDPFAPAVSVEKGTGNS